MGEAKRRKQAGTYPEKTEKPPKPQPEAFDALRAQLGKRLELKPPRRAVAPQK